MIINHKSNAEIIKIKIIEAFEKLPLFLNSKKLIKVRTAVESKIIDRIRFESRNKIIEKTNKTTRFIILKKFNSIDLTYTLLFGSILSVLTVQIPIILSIKFIFYVLSLSGFNRNLAFTL
ncbi:MAG: hypothetical protein A2X13_06500 [Bacteroidetes bacterium GWC2_33_15]|nr:MAG: hypothetical protein A2X10_03395 [Bacteroidetes bacterium GWA2_33_15]OFX52432.1 MAG: hypothetical protein A2X13_06500 [Bacteroidetes bacterium GWC2_33_15]OFX65494.1 MAG: hypothetical protein A2X15_14615 [Bacteroidetes bacterium GWB2_32_14]OFX67513.1 MAG: hypothetical protein A2X14_11330 [Bacteroidetes bacterium GWD2_33_33]